MSLTYQNGYMFGHALSLSPDTAAEFHLGGIPGTAPLVYNPVRPAGGSASTATKKPAFRYTIDAMAEGKLTPRQREFYEENGFLVIPNLVPDDLLDACYARFLDLVNGRVAEPGSILMMKDFSLKDRRGLPKERIYNKIQDFVWDDVLSQYICLPAVLDYVQCFVGPDIRAVHTMLINKPPDAGTETSRHPLHQDLHYFPFRPADRIVAAWTAMEHIDDSNGCLVVQPGTHKVG
jgi:phytanoyl-CoA hydroxylase